MSAVTELGYFGIGVRDLAAWQSFVADVLGLEVLEGPKADEFLVRWDYWQYRMVVRQDPKDDIDFVGWRVAGPRELDSIARRLTEAGVAFTVASADEVAGREVLGMIRLADPAGIPTEIFYGPRIETGLPFHPGRRMHGKIVTGAGGLGHIVLDIPDRAAGERFYMDLLGMRGSLEYDRERPGFPRLLLSFMSCNQRQHSLAFGKLGRGKILSHVMTEFEMLEDVGLARDVARRHNTPFVLDIGQHHNDRAVSFYVETPSGWAWELGWGVVPPSGQAEYGTMDIWGHNPVGLAPGPKSEAAPRAPAKATG